MSDMFWGLNLKPNRKYSQTTAKSFHISQAALDRESLNSGYNQIHLTINKQTFLLCTLRKDACEQVPLDLSFGKGDEISFHSKGDGNVTLSGYIIFDDQEIDFDEENFSIDDIEKKTKKKLKQTTSASSGDDDDEDDEDDDEDDDDDDDNDEDEDVVEQGDGEEESDEDDDEEEDEETDEEVQQPKAKQPKLDKQQNGVAKANEKKSKKDKKENKQPQQQQQKTLGERSLSGGVKVTDITVGNGPEAKQGKRAAVYYEGRLKSNNKVFDSMKNGSGFKFTIGRGEVIKGWDIGVAGMKVGGKRRILCPPHMAYGARGSPPTIPPNSTLVFEVELKTVN